MPMCFFMIFEGVDDDDDVYVDTDVREGTYAHTPLWKNGLIFMCLVYRIMTKIYGAIFNAVFY